MPGGKCWRPAASVADAASPGVSGAAGSGDFRVQPEASSAANATARIGSGFVNGAID
jgi:hypothetical protein